MIYAIPASAKLTLVERVELDVLFTQTTLPDFFLKKAGAEEFAKFETQLGEAMVKVYVTARDDHAAGKPTTECDMQVAVPRSLMTKLTEEERGVMGDFFVGAICKAAGLVDGQADVQSGFEVDK